jgi:hypothetical protein
MGPEGPYADHQQTVTYWSEQINSKSLHKFVAAGKQMAH